MKLFIGTLYTIENEFEECVASIRKQTFTNYEHFVFRGLPNKLAHDSLYRCFMEKADQFDLLIKVDADMVLTRETLFSDIVSLFESNALLKDLEIAVHDFFSAQLIWGMHAYRNTVLWSQSDERIFVDSCNLDEGERIRDNSHLAPAAYHCKNPSLFQSFHYGVHKAIKIVQPGHKNTNYWYSIAHWNIFTRMQRNFLNSGDRRVGLGVLGAEVSFLKNFRPEHLDFSNPYLPNLFKKYQSLSTQQIRNLIELYSSFNFGFLPSDLRRRVLAKVCHLRNSR